jgi:hypothetical protein
MMSFLFGDTTRVGAPRGGTVGADLFPPSDPRSEKRQNDNDFPAGQQEKPPDDGQRRYPKHVEFYDRINLDNWCV